MRELNEISLKVLLFGCLFYLFFASEVPISSQDVCRFFPNNTVIRDPDSCAKSITCIDFKSHPTTTCTGSLPFYDKNTNKCVQSISNDTICQISCAKSAGKFVADPKSCFGYYFCQDEELAVAGNCPDGTHFNVTKQMCVYKEESECRVHDFDFCSIVKDGVRFTDEKNCDKYLTCKKGNLTTDSCSKQYYQPALGTCVPKSQVDCPNHPNDKCGPAKSPKKNEFVSDGATCRGYFFCAAQETGYDENPYWNQCPPDTFFDAKKKICANPLTVKCDEDRCDGRTKTFVSSGTKGCRHYLHCENGVTQAESSCGNAFFDEEMGACVSSIVKYDSCSG